MSKVKVTRPLNAVTENKTSETEGLRTSNFVYGWSTMIRITDVRGDLKDHGH